MVAERVSPRAAGNPVQMEQMRTWLAQPAVTAAHDGTFIPPTSGEDATKPFWPVRVPVDYSFDQDAGSHGENRRETHAPGLANCRRGATGMPRGTLLPTAWSPAA